MIVHCYMQKIMRKISAFILVLVSVLIISGNYYCPFYLFFKIPCPGCGMTRACFALLKMNFQEAFHYHCLFPIPLLWAGYHLFQNHIKRNRRLENVLIVLSILLFFIRWVIILFFYK